MEELKRCPFCGGRAKINSRKMFYQFPFSRKPNVGLYWGECQTCFADGQASWTIEGAIRNWNRRVVE